MSESPNLSRQHPPDVIALDLIIDSGAVLYLDPAGEPRIRRSSDCPEDIPWQVRSRVTEGWIANLYFEKTHRLLGRREIDRVLLCLEGKAAENSQVDMELCDAIETEPVLGLLIQLIRHEQHLKTTADDLLRQLQHFARERAHVLCAPLWPNTTEALGKRLRRIIPWLNKAEVEINFRREGQNRWIIFDDRLNRSHNKPSQYLSHSNSPSHGDFQHNDGSDSADIATPEVEFDQIMKGLNV